MGGLCGWLAMAPSDPPAAAALLHAMAEAVTRHDGAACVSASCATGSVAAAAVDGAAHAHCDGQQAVAIWGHVRGAELGRDRPGPALLALYRQRGAECIARLSGHYAVAVLDGVRGVALLAVDRMATRPLYYTADTHRIAFSTRLDGLDPMSRHAPSIDPQALYDYVHFHMVPAPRTAVKDRHALTPGTVVQWHRGQLTCRPYWTMHYAESERTPPEYLASEFIDLVRAGVREAAAGGAAGAFLSGGTDSSTVAGMLRDVTGEPPRTYSIGFDADGYDETAYARIAARHFGARHREYYVTAQDVVRAIPRIAAVHDQPFGNASAVPAYYCAALAAEDGVNTMLGGDGGDELFGGNERYAKQYLYSLYADLPPALRRTVEPVVGLLPSIGYVGRAQRYMRNACMPMPERYDNHNLLRHLGPREVFTEAFLGSVDPGAPLEMLSRDYARAHARSLINRMLALDLKYTLADNDLPKVGRACELAGVAARFPLLTDELVAFSARLAPQLKLRRTALRWFFKQALRDYLPREILAKRKHGFGLPFGPWLLTHGPLRELAFDSLSALKGRGIVQPALIDRLVSVHIDTHAAYYGTLVWVLMMLELWLERRAPARIAAPAAAAVACA